MEAGFLLSHRPADDVFLRDVAESLSGSMDKKKPLPKRKVCMYVLKCCGVRQAEQDSF